ncbi:hypothetical protein [Olleya sp. R77988]|uniref:hypothetical protein n=1 Tax=Olleya sp. R77988 TaxID=3093875 RepID=UPI0037CB8C7B
MIRQKITYLLFLTLLLSTLSFSQSSSRTTIVENVNATKAGLVHVLNRTGDTIILKSSKQIFRFSFLFHSQKESVLMDLGSKEAKIPLHHFAVGRYTVVAYREDAVYPISLNRIGAISKPSNAVADLEEDVLRASLPEAELRKRNITPRGKKERDTRLANVAPKPGKSRAEAEAKERERKARIKKEADAKANKERALVQAENKKREAREKAVAEAKAKEKKELALAQAKEKEAKEKAIAEAKAKEERQLAQIEANRKAIKERAKAEAKRKERQAIASAETDKKREIEKSRLEREKAEKSREIERKKVDYNISDVENEGLEKQSREEYRKEHLRPNGKKYEEAIEEDRKNKK